MTSGMSRAVLGLALGLLAVLPAGGESPAPEAPSAGPEQVLARTIQSPVTSATLEDALGALERQARKAGRLLIIVDWAELGKIGVTRDTPVTIKQDKATVQQYIELALRSASPKDRPLGWYRMETTVFVTTQEYVLANKSRLGTLTRTGDRKPAAAKEGEPGRARRGGMGGFDETPLETVIERFRETTDLSFHVNWKALDAIGVTKNTPVTLKVRNITADRALDLICDDLVAGGDRLKRVYWYVEDGIVFLSSGQALNETPLTSETYALGGLMMDIPDFIGPRIDVTKLGSNQQSSGNNDGIFGNSSNKSGDGDSEQNPDDKAQDRAGRRKALQESIVNVIKNSVGKDMWEPDGKGRIAILRDKVIVSQTKLGWILMGRAADKK